MTGYFIPSPKDVLVGLTIRDALARGTFDKLSKPGVRYWILKSKHSLQKLNREELEEMFLLEYDLVTSLIKKLSSGIFEATGIWNGGRAREPILPSWWGDSELNVDLNEAKGHGSIITGIRITAGANHGQLPAPASGNERAEQQQVVIQHDISEWYKNRVANWPAHGRHPSQADDKVEAENYFEGKTVRREYLQYARTKHAPDSWKKRGPAREKVVRKIK
jgi:hypothetical protein